MSANIFTMKPLIETPTKTRIPIASPSPLRRSFSLRAHGEKNQPPILSNPLYPQELRDRNTGLNLIQCRRTNSTDNPLNRRNVSRANNPPYRNSSTDRNPESSVINVQHKHGNSVGNQALRRGNSFMERGEHRLENGVSKGNVKNRDVTKNGGMKATLSPSSPSRSRSLSLSITNNGRLSVPKSPSVASSPKTPPTSPLEYQEGASRPDWDTESITSAISCMSLASSSCDHASVARNGTTFSGRSMKYVFHCNQHAGQTGEDYLTPTQRAHRQVRRLKNLLQQAQKDLELKDSDIIKLTKEVVELRLYKAALSSPEERSSESDAVTVRENHLEEFQNGDVADGIIGNLHIPTDMTNSFTDSGHYDDYTNSSIHSKESIMLGEDFGQSPFKRSKPLDLLEKSTSTELFATHLDTEHQFLMTDYEKRIAELIKSHESETQEQRIKHNEKVEELLQRIAEINKRYWELVPDLDNAKERIKELELQLEDALRKLEEQEDKSKQSYLQVYAPGDNREQEQQVMELSPSVPTRISVPELLQQLQVTQVELENIKDIDYASTSNNKKPLLSAKEAVTLWVLGARKAMYKQVMEAKTKKIDPEITLQFLKSAIYYFLTDKENNQGHLRAIQSILGFTPSEISHIEKARTT